VLAKRALLRDLFHVDLELLPARGAQDDPFAHDAPSFRITPPDRSIPASASTLKFQDAPRANAATRKDATILPAAIPHLLRVRSRSILPRIAIVPVTPPLSL